MEVSTSDDDAVKREIINTRKAIQEKYNLLKRNKEETEEYLKMKYQPLLNPMKEFLASKQDYTAAHQPKIKLVKHEALAQETPHLPPKRMRFLKMDEEELYSSDEPKAGPSKHSPTTPIQDVWEQAKTPKGKEILQDYLDQVGELSSKYIRKFVDIEAGKDLDRVYGVIYNGRNFAIGDTVISLNKDILTIGDSTYYGTPGLCELLFMKNPNLSLANKVDFENYKKILKETNVIHTEHSPNKPVLQLKSNLKYRKVISKLFPPKKGAGPTVDPNILVNKLRVLLTDKNSKDKVRQIEDQLRAGGIIA